MPPKLPQPEQRCEAAPPVPAQPPPPPRPCSQVWRDETETGQKKKKTSAEHEEKEM